MLILLNISFIHVTLVKSVMNVVSIVSVMSIRIVVEISSVNQELLVYKCVYTVL